jgi:transcriptional regulator with XRE-family HTH domain
MEDLDKASMGNRIRQIRTRAELRQWELAKFLGTTQSAVHKYEHGVVPEPRRLVELARVGETSIEWILTGNHWENGSREQKRLSPDLMNTACLFREIQDEKRASVDEALRIVREAVLALASGRDSSPVQDPKTLAAALQAHSGNTLRLLEDAWRIQQAVLHRVMDDAGNRLRTSPMLPQSDEDQP